MSGSSRWDNGDQQARDASRRRSILSRRRPRSSAIADLMADLERIEREAATARDTVDGDDRDLLIDLYKELISSVEGPVVPFPLELLEDPGSVGERAEAAEVIDLAALRRHRDERSGAAPPDPGDGPA